MNVSYIILASKKFDNKYPGIATSLSYGFSSYPDDDFYNASVRIRNCFKTFSVTEGPVSFDVDFCNSKAKGHGMFIITAIYNCTSETFYVIPSPWEYADEMIEKYTDINLNQVAIGYDKFFDDFEENLRKMSTDKLNDFMPAVLNIQTRITEFYGNLMLADKEGYYLPERYQNNLYWRLPRSIKWVDRV